MSEKHAMVAAAVALAVWYVFFHHQATPGAL